MKSFTTVGGAAAFLTPQSSEFIPNECFTISFGDMRACEDGTPNRHSNMAILTAACKRCGSEIDVTAGQTSVHGKLAWHKSFSCPFCGASAEEDGWGAAPEELRRAILDQDGYWQLDVAEAGRRATLVIKSLRAPLGLSLKEAAMRQNRLPGVVARGTRAEMDHLHSILSAAGLIASVVGPVSVRDTLEE